MSGSAWCTSPISPSPHTWSSLLSPIPGASGLLDQLSISQHYVSLPQPGAWTSLNAKALPILSLGEWVPALWWGPATCSGTFCKPPVAHRGLLCLPVRAHSFFLSVANAYLDSPLFPLTMLPSELQLSDGTHSHGVSFTAWHIPMGTASFWSQFFSCLFCLCTPRFCAQPHY